MFGHRRALRGFTSVFLWLLLTEVLLLHLSSYDITTYGPPFALGILVAYLIIRFGNRPIIPGTTDSLGGAEMLNLVQAIDKAWDKPGSLYYLRIVYLIEPIGFILIPVAYFVLLVSLVNFSFNEKITLTVALVALMIALLSLSLQFIGDRIDDGIQDITEGTIFRKVSKPYAQSVYPIIRAVIRKRYESPLWLKLEDLYNLDETLFNQHALLESLFE